MHNFSSPLRYPGGKGAIANFIKLLLVNNNLLDGDYVEIYAGGAGVAWSLLFEEYVQRVHINDLNKSVFSFWDSVKRNPGQLCRMIADTPVNMDSWQKQRSIQSDIENYSPVEVGFSTFFLNRTNRSGILDAGVIGGKEQKGDWKLDARYNKADLIQRIERIARYSDRIKIYNMDAADFIASEIPKLPKRSFVYLDPPYFKKGQDLYVNHYQPKDHSKIADLVFKNIKQSWVTSYDAAPEILALYRKYPKLIYKLNYSAQDRYAGDEVMFFSKKLIVPEVTNPTRVGINMTMKPLL